jgi:hypothetical protein
MGERWLLTKTVTVKKLLDLCIVRFRDDEARITSFAEAEFI